MRKLLKYDLQSIFRVWWIASVAMMGLAALGGLCVRGLSDINMDALPPQTQILIGTVCGLGLVFTVLGGVAYALIVHIFVLLRYYRHFFTDEGYLTFTLPVSRRSLLGSKLLAALIAELATFVVLLGAVATFITVGFAGRADIWAEINTIDLVGFEEIRSIFWLGLAVGAASLVFQVLYEYLCITLGSVIARKNKGLAAIGVYIGGNMILSFGSQIVSSVMLSNMVMSNTYYETVNSIMTMEVVGLVFQVGLAVACWFVNLHLLEHKLNLS